MMHRSRILVVVASTVALTAVLSGCGGSAKAGAASLSAPAASVPAAPTPTPTPTPTGPPALTTATFATTVVAAMKGVSSYETTASNDDPQAPMTGTGSVVATPGAEAIDITMQIGADNGTFGLRVVGGKTYMSISKITGAKFFVLDPSKPSSPFSAADLADLMRSLDVSTDVTDVQAAIVAVAEAGAPEALDDVQAQPYDLTIDTTKLSADKKAELTSSSTPLPPTYTMRVWLGPDDVIRKDSYTINGVTDVTTFGHFGAVAPIVPPTAAQLTRSPF